MRILPATLTALAGLCLALPAAAQQHKETIVLVHGAFAESASWNGVVAKLEKDGYKVIAAANPLRDLHGDAEAVAAVVRSVKGPVVLVGHSYGGPVITEAAEGNANVKALVYVSGFAPDIGESALALSGKFPGSTLGGALQPVPLSGGGVDLYIQQDKFHAQFAADVPADEAALMAATQRPVTQAALEGTAKVAAWKHVPSYMIYGSDDRNIPAAAMAFMAYRMHAKQTVVIPGASHALAVSHPAEVAAMIEAAAEAK
jgi:pimeloyl-ACP methyl ester carboxylesterase